MVLRCLSRPDRASKLEPWGASFACLRADLKFPLHINRSPQCAPAYAGAFAFPRPYCAACAAFPAPAARPSVPSNEGSCAHDPITLTRPEAAHRKHYSDARPRA